MPRRKKEQQEWPEWMREAEQEVREEEYEEDSQELRVPIPVPAYEAEAQQYMQMEMEAPLYGERKPWWELAQEGLITEEQSSSWEKVELDNLNRHLIDLLKFREGGQIDLETEFVPWLENQRKLNRAISAGLINEDDVRAALAGMDYKIRDEVIKLIFD